MQRLGWLRWKKSLAALAVLLILGGVMWLKRTPLLTWYYLRGLANASEAERATWVERVVTLDSAAVPGLLACLRRDDARVCTGTGAALTVLVERWHGDDPRKLALAGQLAETFAGQSLPGRRITLGLEAILLAPGKAPPPAAVVRAAGQVLRAAAQGNDRRLHARALTLADALVDRQPPPEILEAIAQLARSGLASPDPANRRLAASLTRARAFRDKTDLLELVLPLLRDPSAAVRRQAIRAVGLKGQLISTEDLLHWLHDRDAQVRRWCGKALRGRGLSNREIQLGRLITDRRAKERLKVFLYLRRPEDGEPAIKAPGDWVSRLYEDPEPAVKIAAARATRELHLVDLNDRLREMAQNDPSPTVRQAAEFYYRARQPVH
jgi:hypothetical protein